MSTTRQSLTTPFVNAASAPPSKKPPRLTVSSVRYRRPTRCSTRARPLGSLRQALLTHVDPALRVNKGAAPCGAAFVVDRGHFNPVKHGHAVRVGEWSHSSFRHWVRLGAYHKDWAGDLSEESHTSGKGDGFFATLTHPTRGYHITPPVIVETERAALCGATLCRIWPGQNPAMTMVR